MRLTNDLDVNVKLLVGGRVKRVMRNPPVGEVDILIATLGALCKLVTTKIYKVDQVQHVVLDEADSLLDITFQEKLKSLLKKIEVRS